MSTGKVRTAVVGAGKIGKWHAIALSQIEGAELTAICDLNEENARAVALESSAKMVSTDLAKLIADKAIDAVSICTDHGSHLRLVEMCAAGGVHCIVEKPLSIRLSDAQRMVEVAKAAGIICGTVFQRRYFPAAQRMKAAIAGGAIGQPTIADCTAFLDRDKAYFDMADWRGTWAGEGGGVLMNQAIHMVDLLQWMMGDAVEVYGRWATLRHGDYINVEDTTAAVVTFASGALATIQATTTVRPQFGFGLSVRGTTGDTLAIREMPELTVAVQDSWTLAEDGREPWERAGTPPSMFPDYHRAQLEDFIEAVRTGQQLAVPAEEGLKSMHIIKGIYLSQHRGRPVSLPLSQSDIAEVEKFDTTGWK